MFEQKVWSESKSGEREWGETLKNTLSPFLDWLQTFHSNIDRRSRSQKNTTVLQSNSQWETVFLCSTFHKRSSGN